MRVRSVIAAMGWIVPFIAFGMVRARVALAEPVATPTGSPTPSVEAPPSPPWSILAGVGILPMLGLGAAAFPIGGFVTLERRLTGPLFLVARFSGSVGYSVDTTRDDPDPPSSVAASARGAAGLRVALGSRDTLEVSPFALLVAGYTWVGAGEMSVRASSVGGELGVSLDRDIVRNFGIRVSATLANVDHTWWASRYVDPNGELLDSESSSTNLSLAILPVAELRWSF